MRPGRWWVAPEGRHHSRAGHRKGMDLKIGREPQKVALGRQKTDSSLTGSTRVHNDKNQY